MSGDGLFYKRISFTGFILSVLNNAAKFSKKCIWPITHFHLSFNNKTINYLSIDLTKLLLQQAGTRTPKDAQTDHFKKLSKGKFIKQAVTLSKNYPHHSYNLDGQTQSYFIILSMQFIEGKNRNQSILFPKSPDQIIEHDNEVRIIDLFCFICCANCNDKKLLLC